MGVLPLRGSSRLYNDSPVDHAYRWQGHGDRARDQDPEGDGREPAPHVFAFLNPLTGGGAANTVNMARPARGPGRFDRPTLSRI